MGLKLSMADWMFVNPLLCHFARLNAIKHCGCLDTSKLSCYAITSCSPRGLYLQLTPAQNFQIGKIASQHGTTSAQQYDFTRQYTKCFAFCVCTLPYTTSFEMFYLLQGA